MNLSRKADTCTRSAHPLTPISHYTNEFCSLLCIFLPIKRVKSLASEIWGLSKMQPSPHARPAKASPSPAAPNPLAGLKVEQSEEDRRQYRLLRLPNGLTAVLIHDNEIHRESEDADDRSEYEVTGSEGSSIVGASSEEDDEDEHEEMSAGSEGGHTSSHGGGPTKKAAAALAVAAGSFSDPDDVPGLAHFLEHMLFMGSEDFPDENEYDKYLSQNGGHSNAFTENEMTVYYFDVRCEHLAGALARFSAFFRSPLIKQSAMEREVEAVESEFEIALSSDANRLSQVQCATCLAGHVYSKFVWGNKRSLSTSPSERTPPLDVRESVLRFYEEHYVPQRMTLSLIGAESLDELEELVHREFSGIKGQRADLVHPFGEFGQNLEAPARCFAPNFAGEGPPFSPGCLRLVDAVRDTNEIHLTWALPSLLDRFQSKAEDYASHLIGHEGPGSLTALVKKRGWATDLWAGTGDSGSDRSSACFTFGICVVLTEVGLEHLFEIISLIAWYTGLCSRDGVQLWVYDELRGLSEMRFRFEEEREASAYVVELAENLQRFPARDCVRGDSIYRLWDPELAASVLSALTPSSCRIDLLTRMHFSPDLIPRAAENMAPGLCMAPELVEPWFGVRYRERSMASDTLEGLEQCFAGLIELTRMEEFKELSLPTPNPFVPSDFSLRSGKRPEESTHHDSGKMISNQSGAHPTPPTCCVRETQSLRVWHKLDNTFFTPRAQLYLYVHCPEGLRSSRNSVLQSLFVSALNEMLNQVTYLADVAGLHFHLAHRPGSNLEIRIDGFSDKLCALLRPVLSEMFFGDSFKIDLDRFNALREQMERNLRNAKLKPNRHALYERLRLMTWESLWTIEERLQHACDVSIDDLRSYVSSGFDSCSVEALAHGNIDTEEAIQIADMIRAAMDRHAPQTGDNVVGWIPRPRERVVCLTPGKCYRFSRDVDNPSEENSVLDAYYQTDLPYSPRSMALLDLVCMLTNEPFFDTLRTKEQLGYSVNCSSRCTGRVLGLGVVIQSALYDPLHLESRVEAFFANFDVVLQKMPPSEFERTHSALASELRTKHNNLIEESDSHWAHISTGTYRFSSRQEEASALEDLTMDDVLAFYRKYICPGSLERRRLSVHVHGKYFPVASFNVESEGVANDCTIIVKSAETFRTCMPWTNPRGGPFDGLDLDALRCPPQQMMF